METRQITCSSCGGTFWTYQSVMHHPPTCERRLVGEADIKAGNIPRWS